MKREGHRTISILVGLCLASLLTPDVAHTNDLELRLEGLYLGKIVGPAGPSFLVASIR